MPGHNTVNTDLIVIDGNVQAVTFDDSNIIAAIEGITFDDSNIIAAIEGITFDDSNIITAIEGIAFDDSNIITAIEGIAFDDTRILNLLKELVDKVTLVQVNHNCQYEGQDAMIKYYSDDTAIYSVDGGATWTTADQSKITCPCCSSEAPDNTKNYCPLLNLNGEPNRAYYRTKGGRTGEAIFFNWGYGTFNAINALSGLQAGTLQHSVTLHFNGINGPTTGFTTINFNPDPNAPRAYVSHNISAGNTLNSVGYVGVYNFDYDDGSGEIHSIELRYEFELNGLPDDADDAWRFIELTDFTCNDLTYQNG